jgi:hypothetical protein
MSDALLQIYPNDTHTIPLTNANWSFTVRDCRLAIKVKLTPAARLVFYAICARCGYEKGKWTCYPSYELISHDTGLSVRHVIRMCNLLAKKELIHVKPRYDEDGLHISNLFTLPAERMWAAAKETIKEEKERAERKREAKQAEVDAFLKVGVAPVSLDDQANVVDLAGSAATFITDDDDIATSNAKADAACVAATGGDCLTVATEAPAAPSRLTAKAAARLQELQGDVRNIYASLKRADLPEDLTPSARALEVLQKREGLQEAYRVYMFAIEYTDPFWFNGMRNAKDGPVAYLDRNFEAIRKQADEAAAKKSKAKPAPTSKKSWNQAAWQRRYDEANADQSAACDIHDYAAYESAQHPSMNSKRRRPLMLLPKRWSSM